MSRTTRLNKQLWTNVTRLKLFAKGDEHSQFFLEYNPFDDEDEERAAAKKDEYVIIGRVLPKEGIYKNIGFRIEIKLTSGYPIEAPAVRILSHVYHPNIEADGMPKLIQ